jgi:hypothetical protein
MRDCVCLEIRSAQERGLHPSRWFTFTPGVACESWLVWREKLYQPGFGGLSGRTNQVLPFTRLGRHSSTTPTNRKEEENFHEKSRTHSRLKFPRCHKIILRDYLCTNIKMNALLNSARAALPRYDSFVASCCASI